MTKRKISENVEDFGKYDFIGKTSEAVKFFQSLEAKYGPESTIEWTTDYNEEVYFYVDVHRDETDDEYKSRLEQEAFYAKNREELERKQYEELKKKFG